MKNIRLIVLNGSTPASNIKDCTSLYHKKLTDSFKSS